MKKEVQLMQHMSIELYLQQLRMFCLQHTRNNFQSRDWAMKKDVQHMQHMSIELYLQQLRILCLQHTRYNFMYLLHSFQHVLSNT
jgi:hypothetical protein